MSDAAASITVTPADDAGFEAVQAVFGARGDAAVCQCQRYKLARKESFGSLGVEERRHRLRAQLGCDDPGTGTSGLVAYLDGEPVGWCAVEPRPAYVGLVRVYRIPWQDRDEDRADASVWAITCLVTRVGFRGRGVAHALVVAAVDHARAHGARAVEAYPTTKPDAPWGEAHVGTPQMYAAAGLVEVSRPSHRRLVMRREL